MTALQAKVTKQIGDGQTAIDKGQDRLRRQDAEREEPGGGRRDERHADVPGAGTDAEALTRREEPPTASSPWAPVGDDIDLDFLATRSKLSGGCEQNTNQATPASRAWPIAAVGR